MAIDVKGLKCLKLDLYTSETVKNCDEALLLVRLSKQEGPISGPLICLHVPLGWLEVPAQRSA